jgi:serine phosphatase RsbU (regulator of sigma subunit)
MNGAVFAASGGESNMTCVLSVVDLESGRMDFINASHCTPYLHRAKAGGAPSVDGFEPLVEGKCSPLGAGPELDARSSEFQFQASDTLFWYTDGLLDNRNPDGKKVSKSQLVQTFANLLGEHGDSPKTICEQVLATLRELEGKTLKEQDDDMTVVVVRILDSASQRKSGDEAA